MSGLAILDLVIGLTFIYFLLSLVCSAVQEIIANLRHLRHRVLLQWVLRTFHLNNFGVQILNHQMIDGLSHSGKPSYIPSDKFAQAVLDLVHSQVNGDQPFDINSLRTAVEQTMLLPPGLKRFVLQSIMEANAEVSKVRADLAKWYDDAMERVTGYYKKKIQEAIIITALIVAAIFNADSIRIAKYLYNNPEAARELADQASRIVADTTIIKKVEEIRAQNDSLSKTSEQALAEIQSSVTYIKATAEKIYQTKLPLGWSGETLLDDGDKKTEQGDGNNVGRWLEKLIGLLLTALAVSLGTPFWFEMLNKLVNLRNAGNKPKTEGPTTDEK
jgi:hypothetical protein